MAQNESEARHTVIIVGVTDVAARLNVARALSQVAKNQTSEQIIKRLDALPWTLTRSATTRRASRLVKMLEPLGAEMKTIPPLADPDSYLRPDTEILPGAELLSQSQMMSATQFIPPPTAAEFAQAQRSRDPSGTPPPITPDETAPAPVEDAASVSRRAPEAFQEDDFPGGPGVGFAIEPLSLSEMLDRSFQICRTWFWKLFLILAIPWLVTAALAAPLAGLFVFFFGTAAFSGPGLPHGPGSVVPIVLGSILILIAVVVILALMYISQGAIIYAVSSVYMGREVDIKESYLFVFKILVKFVLTSILFLVVCFGLVLLPFFGTMLLYGIFSLFTSGWWSAVFWPFLFILPFYAFPKLLLFDRVVIIENIAYMGALHRSWNLVSGKAEGSWPRSYWMKLVVLLHLFIFILVGVSFLFHGVGLLMSYPFSGSLQIVGGILNQIVSTIGSTITSMFASVALVVFYYDVRNRKEGFDLRMLAGMHDRL